MILSRLSSFTARAALPLGPILALLIATGCDGGGGGGGSATNEADAFVGTWQLFKGKALEGEPIWYVHFKGDNTLFFSNFPDGSRVRSTGTYSVSGGNLVGPFANPPTGNGRVEAKLVNSTMLDLDFIEYWHTPNKVIHYAGRKR